MSVFPVDVYDYINSSTSHQARCCYVIRHKIGKVSDVDLYIIPRYVSETPTTSPVWLPSVYTMARTWGGTKNIRLCREMETSARMFSTRLSTWYNPNDYFSNRTTITSIAVFSIAKDVVTRMPTKRKTNEFVRESVWKGFLEYRLSDLELIDADEAVISDEELLDGVVTLSDAGYKLTLSYNAQNKTATATLQAGEVMPKLVGWALSAKGRDGREAIKLLLYKHHECLKGDWLPLLTTTKPVQRG